MLFSSPTTSFFFTLCTVIPNCHSSPDLTKVHRKNDVLFFKQKKKSNIVCIYTSWIKTDATFHTTFMFP
jgi:hypothetical protein